MAFFEDISQKTKNMSEIAKCNNAIAEDERNCNNTLLLIGQKYAETYTYDSDLVPNEFRSLLFALHQAKKRIADNKRRIEDLKGMVHCSNCGTAQQPESLFCTNCGAQMPRPQSQTTATVPPFCSHCGAKLQPDSKFCTSCGNPVKPIPPQPVTESAAPVPESSLSAPEPIPAPESSVPAPESVSTPESPISEPQPSVSTPEIESVPMSESVSDPVRPASEPESSTPQSCPHCGKPAPEGTRFCTKCGTKLG